MVSLAMGVLGCAAALVAREMFAITTLEIRTGVEDGDGSIGAAIRAANEAGKPVLIVSTLPRGAEVPLTRELPWITGKDVELNGRGLVLRDDACVRTDGRLGCSGLVVTGSRVVIRDVVATGFRFDGISVRGADDVAILDCHLFQNLDDGVGISDASNGIRIERCLLERNGYRSKGKGVLVFDHSRAVLRDNEIVRNRDGVTISNRSHAVLERNRITDSYDKGFGVRGASAEGTGNLIAGSGAARFEEGAGPNADGVRVTLDSTVRLERSEIVDSGDRGLVVEGTSRVELFAVTFDGNRGGDYSVGSDARLVVDGRPYR